jgi:hypothetical protein
MFAAMRSLPCIGLAALFTACSGPQKGSADSVSTQADSNYIAEVRITAADTTARLCGSGLRYQVTGPDMDTLVRGYRHAHVREGQWMKVWFAAHPGAVMRNGLPDSALFITKFHHLDASLACDPVPHARLSGTYFMGAEQVGASRRIWLDLHPDGTAVLRSVLDGRPPIEEEGRWGVDVEERLFVIWPQRDQTMRYVAQEDRLVADRTVNGVRPELRREGPVDRSAGSFGRAKRWMLTAAARTGTTADTTALTPTTLLSDALPDPAAHAWLLRTSQDTLHADSATVRLRWTGITDMRGLMRLLRAYAHK